MSASTNLARSFESSSKNEHGSTESGWQKALHLFRNELGEPYQLAPTQIEIIDLIASRGHPRVQLIASTQYGKSLAVAFGVLLRATLYPEKWAIVAPTEDKARIIMGYIIDHIFDSKLFSERLEYFDSKEKLQQARSKKNITFRDAGEVVVYTGNAHNSTQTREALMGFGAPNVILDESALIPDDLYATVKRMLGGSADNFLLEIGNPFYRNHFMRTWHDPGYHRIFVDYHKALEEGRYTEHFIEEMRNEAFFDVLYECKFPEEQEVLPNGYRKLLPNEAIDLSLVDEAPEASDKPVLGIDVAAGGENETKYVLRYPKFAKVARTYKGDDLEAAADIAEALIKEYDITDYRCVIDAGGVGHGLPAILMARGLLPKAVLFGEKAPEAAFANTRAWMYWRLRTWIREGGKLLRDPGFQEVKLIYYRTNPSGKLQIEPKEDMIKRMAGEGTRAVSPDTADALVLTFIDTDLIVEEDDIIIIT